MTTNHKMQQNDAANNGLARVFDGRALQFRTYGGRPCVAAANLGAVLGYEQPRKLVSQIRGPWSGEFAETAKPLSLFRAPRDPETPAKN